MKTTIYSIFIFTLYVFNVVNPVHDKELLSMLFLTIFVSANLITDAIRGKRIYTSNRIYLMFIWLLILVVSYMVTIQSEFNTRPFAMQLIAVCAVIACIVFFDINDIQKIMFAISLGCTIITLTWICSYFLKWGMNINLGYKQSITAHKNIYGMMCAISIPCCLYFVPKLYNYWATLLYGMITVVINLFGLYLSNSRGAYAATIISLTIYMIRARMYYIIFVIAALVASYFYSQSIINPTSNKNALSQIIKSDRQDNIWPPLIKKAVINPFGIGIGNMVLHRSDDQGKTTVTGPHNLYLYLYSIGGWLGLILWSSIIIIALKQSPNIYISLSIISYLLYSFWSECGANNYPNIVVFYSLIGICLRNIKKNYQLIKIGIWKYFPYPLLPALIILVVLSLVSSIKHYNADINYLKQVSAYDNKNYNAALTYANKCLANNPKYLKSRFGRAIIKETLGYPVGAFLDYQYVFDHMPELYQTNKIIAYIETGGMINK